MRFSNAATAGLGLVAALLVVSPAAAQYGMNKNGPKNAATPELPRCEKPLGRAAVREPERDWWTPLGLANPEALLKLYAARSNCLRIVDRNVGLAMRDTEASLGASGDLKRGSNIGKGQVAGADFFIVPDIANSNGNSGGNNIGALAGGLIGGRVGGLIGGLRTNSSEAQALITLVDARSTEQLYVAEGVAKKTDIGFDIGGWGSSAAGSAGGYSNTAIGKVISAAYFNAYVDLVRYLQSNAPPAEEAHKAAAVPSKATGVQAYRVSQAVVMRATASPKAAQVRAFKPGESVYPTGKQNGVWWEVDDENGNRGWLSSAMIAPR